MTSERFHDYHTAFLDFLQNLIPKNGRRELTESAIQYQAVRLQQLRLAGWINRQLEPLTANPIRSIEELTHPEARRYYNWLDYFLRSSQLWVAQLSERQGLISKRYCRTLALALQLDYRQDQSLLHKTNLIQFLQLKIKGCRTELTISETQELQLLQFQLEQSSQSKLIPLKTPTSS